MVKNKTKRIKKQESLCIDNNTGEILGGSSKYVSYGDVDNYVRFYKRSEYKYYRLSLTEKGMLLDMIDFIDYNNRIVLDMDVRGLIAKRNGTGIDVVHRAIKKLVTSGALFRVGMSKYIVNPHFIGCGKQVEIDVLRQKFILTKDGWDYVEF